MILIVTNKRDYTADFLIYELNRRNIKYIRFNTEDLPTLNKLSISLDKKGVQGYLEVQGKKTDLLEIKSIWYRRPVTSIPHSNITDEISRQFIQIECQEVLSGLWNLLECFWVSDPNKLRIAESKLYQLSVANKVGLVHPETLVTNNELEANNYYNKHQKSLIYKPFAYSRFDRKDKLHLIFTNIIKQQHQKEFSKLQYCPSLFQPYIPKQVELRVNVVGNCVFAVELHSQELEAAQYDWRRVDPRKIKHIPHQLPPEVEHACIRLVQELGLAFGAIDLILTPQNNYIFLEINPNGQWAWIQQECPEVDIRGALISLLETGGKDFRC